MKVNNMSEIGRMVQSHRKEAGLSRVSLAEISGVGKTVIYDIEHGKETVKVQTLLKIFETLNISMELSSPLIKIMEYSG